jgi:anti-anti-sigma factor
MTTHLHLEVRTESSAETSNSDGPRVVLVVTGEIDLTNVDAFRRAVAATADGGGGLVLDLQGVRYLDSAGVAALFRQAARVRLEVIVNDLVAPVLRLSALDDVATVRTGSDIGSQ